MKKQKQKKGKKKKRNNITKEKLSKMAGLLTTRKLNASKKQNKEVLDILNILLWMRVLVSFKRPENTIEATEMYC